MYMYMGIINDSKYILQASSDDECTNVTCRYQEVCVVLADSARCIKNRKHEVKYTNQNSFCTIHSISMYLKSSIPL